MKILFSFCNKTNTDGPDLAIYDPDNLSHRFVKLPAGSSNSHGLTGLAAAEGFLYVVPQASSLVSLLTFDLSSFALLHQYNFRSARDVHSICVTGDTLYAVSSGTDEVMKLELRDGVVVSENVCWRPDASAPREDINHLNCVLWSDDQLLVSGFGKKAGQRWATANNGFIYNVTRSETITCGIEHPHSLARIDESIAFCQSRKKTIETVDHRRAGVLDGYARGLCRVGNHLFAATSLGRLVSRSSPLINNSGDPGEVAGRCTVNRLRLDNFEIDATTDFTEFGNEIYDLLPIAEPMNWPLVRNAA